MTAEICHIAIAETDSRLRKQLKGLLHSIFNENNSSRLTVFEAQSIDEMESGFSVHTNIAFLDSSFILKESKRIGRLWSKLKPGCLLVLLLSTNKSEILEEIFNKIEKQKYLPLNAFVLKADYPDEIKEGVVRRVVQAGCFQRNEVLAS